MVFRFQTLADRFSLQAGERITPEVAAGILMHPEGVCKGWTPGTTILPFINKVDGPTQDPAARELAASILRNGNFPVERVLFGSVLQGRVESVSVA